MTSGDGKFHVVIGVALLALGISLLAEAGWYWRTYAPREEPVSPGRTPNPSTAPWRIEGRTEAEQDEAIRRDMAHLRELGRKDVLWMRIHLFAIAPAGFVMAAVGALWLAVDPRRRNGPKSN